MVNSNQSNKRIYGIALIFISLLSNIILVYPCANQDPTPELLHYLQKKKKDKERIYTLLHKGADINGTTEVKLTCSEWILEKLFRRVALRKTVVPLHIFIKMNDLDLIRSCVTRYVTDLDVLSVWSTTALLYTIRWINYTIFKFLIIAGAQLKPPMTEHDPLELTQRIYNGASHCSQRLLCKKMYNILSALQYMPHVVNDQEHYALLQNYALLSDQEKYCVLFNRVLFMLFTQDTVHTTPLYKPWSILNCTAFKKFIDTCDQDYLENNNHNILYHKSTLRSHLLMRTEPYLLFVLLCERILPIAITEHCARNSLFSKEEQHILLSIARGSLMIQDKRFSDCLIKTQD